MKTRLHCLFITILIALTSIFHTSYAQAINTNDSLALVDLYNSTNGAHWTRNTNWLNGPVSTWIGIEVTGTRVTRLALEQNNMTGNLPESIGNLTELTYLDFYFNHLNRNIPSSIGDLTKLTELHLQNNTFTGNIPSSIGNLNELIYLYLNGNQLSGSIPGSIDGLQSVALLYLNGNQLSGSIPETIGNLINLNAIYFGDNQLSGSIPSSIGNLKKLTVISMENNQLSGPLPASIVGLTRLTGINLDNNMLSGKIPAALGNLDKLTTLQLSNNQLTGGIPATLKQAEKLAGLYIDGNQLSEDDNYRFPISKQSLQGSIGHNHFTFNTLEMVAAKFPRLVYYPQADVAIHKNGNTLSVSAGGTLSNNTYKWFRVGDASPTIIIGDSTFSPATAGDYYAQITNAVAHDLVLTTDTVFYSSTLAGDLITQNPGIYPNPVKNILTVSGLNAKLVNNISIADVSGIIWLRITVKQRKTIQYDVSSLKAGIYILYISAEGTTNALHFVKE